MPHTQQQTTPTLACADVQPSPDHYAACILSSGGGGSLATSLFSSFLFPPKVFFVIPLEAILNLVVRDLATAQLEPSAVIVSIKYQNTRGFMVYVITGQINFTLHLLVWKQWSQ